MLGMNKPNIPHPLFLTAAAQQSDLRPLPSASGGRRGMINGKTGYWAAISPPNNPFFRSIFPYLWERED